MNKFARPTWIFAFLLMLSAPAFAEFRVYKAGEGFWAPFPTQPMTKDATQTKTGTFKQYFAVDQEPFLIYQTVNLTDERGNPYLNPRNKMKAYLETFSKGLSGELVSRNAVEFASYPGYEFVIDLLVDEKPSKAYGIIIYANATYRLWMVAQVEGRSKASAEEAYENWVKYVQIGTPAAGREAEEQH